MTRLKIIFPLISFLLLFAVQANAEEEEREAVTAKNTIYIEGLGPGGLYSLNYERRISDLNLRVGAAHWGNSLVSITTIPLGVNYIGIGGDTNHLELGGGATIGIIDGDSLFGDSAGAFGWAIVGFRVQPADGGFNFRVGAMSLLGSFGVLPWGYLSLGATF